jgi:hypothetical protein
MLSVTFTLTNREKTFTHEDLGGCVKQFLTEYGEAVEEAKGQKTCATFIKGFQLKVVQK